VPSFPSFPERVGILADDFTGAGDAALGLSAAGLPMEIFVAEGRFPRGPAPNVRVWVLDTESRALAPAPAARRVSSALEALRRWGADFIYKKIDSALRGPVRAELAIFLRVVSPGARRVVFAPGFPKAGRTTRAGRQYILGKPLHQSIFRRDPLHPARTSSIAEILGENLHERLWTPDVENQADLRAAARAVAGGRVFPGAACGAAGLLEELGSLWLKGAPRRRFPREESAGAISRARTRTNGRGVLVAAGSANPVTRRQVGNLKRRLGDALATAGTPFLSAAAPAVGLAEAPERRTSPGRVLEALMGDTRLLSRRFGFRRFVAAGGETALGLCRLWNVFRWRPAGKVATGVALCVPAAPTKKVRALVSKPGGFGEDDILWKCIRALRRAG
jgi:D-threonate/D-erythronate kinase